MAIERLNRKFFREGSTTPTICTDDSQARMIVRYLPTKPAGPRSAVRFVILRYFFLVAIANRAINVLLQN